MSSLPILLFVVSGFMLEIGMLLDQVSNSRYSDKNYAAFSKYFYYFFWVLFGFGLYGYIYHPLPYFFKISSYGWKFMYHAVIITTYIYLGMSVCYYLFKNIFRK